MLNNITPRRPTVCLSMIVKNEAPVIRRCLASVCPLIDSWVIIDTGSNDGTQEIIREYLRDIPGELHERRGATSRTTGPRRWIWRGDVATTY